MFLTRQLVRNLRKTRCAINGIGTRDLHIELPNSLHKFRGYKSQYKREPAMLLSGVELIGCHFYRRCHYSKDEISCRVLQLRNICLVYFCSTCAARPSRPSSPGPRRLPVRIHRSGSGKPEPDARNGGGSSASAWP